MNDSTAVITDNYGRLQYLILLFKVPMGASNIFSEIYRHSGPATSRGFASTIRLVWNLTDHWPLRMVSAPRTSLANHTYFEPRCAHPCGLPTSLPYRNRFSLKRPAGRTAPGFFPTNEQTAGSRQGYFTHPFTINFIWTTSFHRGST